MNQEIAREIAAITEIIKVVQEGYVKPDVGRGSSNTTGVVRDAKFARPLYKALLDRLATLTNTTDQVAEYQKKEEQYGKSFQDKIPHY